MSLATVPEWLFGYRWFDWLFHIWCAQRGAIGFLDEDMAAYRVHAGGNWSARSRATQLEEDLNVYRAPRGGGPEPARADRALCREPPLSAGDRVGRRGAADPGGAGRAGAGGGRAARLLQRSRGGGFGCRGSRPGGGARGPPRSRGRGRSTAALPRFRGGAAPSRAALVRRCGAAVGRVSAGRPAYLLAGRKINLDRRVVPDLGGRCRFRRFRRSARGSGGRHGRVG